MAGTVIVGAGLAGLVCAKVLTERGEGDFLLLEAEPEPGGRVRSRVTVDGYTLDRGFQVLLDSYPAVRRHLDVPALRPRYFESGAILADPATGRIQVAAHPLRHPADGLATALSDVLPLADKLRLSRLVAGLLATPDDALLAETRSPRDRSTAHYLFERGFSPAAVERFLRPFFAGVFLDETLATSAGLFRYYLKKFATGRALLPAAGIGEIPRQLASKLPAGAFRLGCRVERIETNASRARAVHTADGERVPCERLLLATDPPATARLLGPHAVDADTHGPPPLPTTVAYFSSRESLYDRAMLVLPAGRGRLVRHFVQLTNVAPEYAPDGRHLVSATILDRRGLNDDSALLLAARAEIAQVFPAAAETLEPLAVVHVPYGQRRQPAGFARGLVPAPAPTALENVFLLGDGTTANSIQSAMVSGERAAGR